MEAKEQKLNKNKNKNKKEICLQYLQFKKINHLNKDPKDPEIQKKEKSERRIICLGGGDSPVIVSYRAITSSPTSQLPTFNFPT